MRFFLLCNKISKLNNIKLNRRICNLGAFIYWFKILKYKSIFSNSLIFAIIVLFKLNKIKISLVKQFNYNLSKTIN
jgi:hypothetical protein